MTTITQSEILEALAKATEAPDDAMTSQEIRDFTGFGKDTVGRMLRDLSKEGRLTVHHVVRRALDGRAQRIPAYSVTPKKKAKK